MEAYDKLSNASQDSTLIRHRQTLKGGVPDAPRAGAGCKQGSVYNLEGVRFVKLNQECVGSQCYVNRPAPVPHEAIPAVACEGA